MTVLRICDLETTGLEENDEVVEIGTVDVVGANIGNLRSSLVRPAKPIAPEASAVHHITDADVANAKPWALVWPEFMKEEGQPVPDFYVAHRADFENRFLTDPMRGGRPLICTYKAALRVWPDAPSFSNQALRYWLKLEIGDGASPPHRALPDALVTAHILVEILKKHPVSDLVAWSAKPALLPRIQFGKHAGSAWSDLPRDYLEWMTGPKAESVDADSKWNARHELDRRDGAARATYVAAVTQIVSMATTMPDLMSWFTDGARARHELGITRDTEEYAAIAAACAARRAEIEATTKPEQKA